MAYSRSGSRGRTVRRSTSSRTRSRGRTTASGSRRRSGGTRRSASRAGSGARTIRIVIEQPTSNALARPDTVQTTTTEKSPKSKF